MKARYVTYKVAAPTRSPKIVAMLARVLKHPERLALISPVIIGAFELPPILTPLFDENIFVEVRFKLKEKITNPMPAATNANTWF